MRKWAGKKVYEQMWEPLVIGKFGPYYKDVNMAWMWARLKARTTKLGDLIENNYKIISNGFLLDTDVLTSKNISEGFVIYEKLFV